MFRELEVDVGFPDNVTLGVGGSVHVIRFDRSVKSLYGEFGKFGESRVYEIPGSPGVDDGGGFDDLVIYQDSYRDS